MPALFRFPLLLLFGAGLAFVLTMASCTTSSAPDFLADEDIISTGSKVEFWVDHDEHGWVASNVFIDCLPRPMSGAEARRWAESAGDRDAGIHWTRYYLRVTPPGARQPETRSPVYVLRASPGQMAGRARY